MNQLSEHAWLGSMVRREFSFGPPAVQRLHLADRIRHLDMSPHNGAPIIRSGRVSLEPPRTKVCICGGGLGREEAPLNDPAWEVWAINLCPNFDRDQRLRVDRWFDLHQREAQTPDDMRWIAACPVPIYVPPDLLDASPYAVPYPLEEIEAAFAASYWTCSFAYQIALVLHEGIATDLGLYGLELAFGSRRERTVEWACTAYWIGRAQERGLRIHVPANSTLARHPARYGMEYAAEKQAVEQYIETRHFYPLDELTVENT